MLLTNQGLVVTARCDDASVWVLFHNSGEGEISAAEWKRMPDIPQ